MSVFITALSVFIFLLIIVLFGRRGLPHEKGPYAHWSEANENIYRDKFEYILDNSEFYSHDKCYKDVEIDKFGASMSSFFRKYGRVWTTDGEDELSPEYGEESVGEILCIGVGYGGTKLYVRPKENTICQLSEFEVANGWRDDNEYPSIYHWLVDLYELQKGETGSDSN